MPDTIIYVVTVENDTDGIIHVDSYSTLVEAEKVCNRYNKSAYRFAEVTTTMLDEQPEWDFIEETD